MATIYCGPTSQGSNTGADFSNRTVLPDSTNFVRGNTYVIIGSATGYGNRTLSEPASGASTITIRKANSAQDGAVAGWDSAFETTRANLGTLFVQTDYWVVGGVFRNESNWFDDDAYGIHVTLLFFRNLSPETAGNNCSFSYLDIGSRAYSQTFQSGDESEAVYCGGFDTDVLNLSLYRCFLHNGSFVQLAGVDGFTMDGCALAAGYAKESVRGQNTAKNGIIRFCMFYNASQSNPDEEPPQGSTADIAIWDDGSSGQTSFDNWEIYGNVIWNDKQIQHTGGCIVVGGNGTSWAGSSASNVKIYNNTIAGITDNSAPYILINGGTGNEVRNNLLYDCDGTPSFSPNTSSNGEEASDPFVDYTGFDFRLVAPIPGTDLPSPYNVDILGNTRGVDGDFDRGAYEYEEDQGTITVNLTNFNVTGTLTVG